MNDEPWKVPAKLLLFAEREADMSAAIKLSEQLHIPVIQGDAPLQDDALLLRLNGDGLALVGNGQVLQSDFKAMLPRLKPHNLYGEMIVKAAKIKGAEHPLTVVDATAGFGEDSLLLAAAGFSVKLYEYNPVIALLLQDALRRGEEVAALHDIVGRMELFQTDSIQGMAALPKAPDVILLDPMFPARKKSALVKKKFQLLHKLECPCVEEEALLRAAIAAHPHKIVIKRPLKGAYLAEIKPAYSLMGKSIRYDCLVLP